MDDKLTELLKEFYNMNWDNFSLAMKDRWSNSDYDLDKQQRNKIKELEDQIDEYASRRNAFELFTSSIEEIDPELFNKLTSDLDSEIPGTFITLFDLMDKYNNIHKSKCVIEPQTLKRIKIKY